jgi:hypothetical protein
MAWAAGLRLSFDPEGVAVSTQALGKNCRVLHASATNSSISVYLGFVALRIVIVFPGDASDPTETSLWLYPLRRR